MFGPRTLVLAGAVWAVTLNLTACTSSHSAEDPRTAPQLAEVAMAQPAEVGERAFTGVVSARVQSNLGFRVSGKVIERMVDSGQAVREGQPLMRLDRTDYTHGITAQVGNVDAARARLQQAAADEARYSGLVASGAVSQSAYDQIKAAADSARALLSAAEAQLKVAQDEGAYATLVADAADPLTRTFEARYVLDGVAARAPLGATVTVYLKDSEPSGALSVPLGALDDEGRGSGVWMLDRQSSSVSYRLVKFIRFDGERAIVSGGIHIGDPIIAVGGHFLHEGQRVQIMRHATRDAI